jgi:predicted dehydrogenase
MRALIVSLGSIGRRHLANLRDLRPEAEIAVVRRHASATPPPGADYLFTSLDDACDFEPEVAIVAGPASLHVKAAAELAARKIHLFIEKPLSNELEGVDELLETCAKNDLVLMVGYVLRFCPAVRRLQQELSTGRIGRLLSLRAEVGQYLPQWRPEADYREGVSAKSTLGGGAILELSHELDLALWLGGEVRALAAQTATIGDLDLDVEDLAEIILEFKNGALGSVHLDMLRRPPARRCEVAGERGVLSLDLLRKHLTLREEETGAPVDLYGPDPTDRNAMYLSELDHFLGCVEAGGCPTVGGVEGRAALALAVAAKRSAETGRTLNL